MSLAPASGIGRYLAGSGKMIRVVRYGCTNRPFFHIVVMQHKHYRYMPCIEQLGTYDPMPNQYNEKLVSLNYERVKYWLGQGANLSQNAAILLGLSGYLPIHPKSYMTAWRNREKMAKSSEPAAEKSEETA